MVKPWINDSNREADPNDRHARVKVYPKNGFKLIFESGLSDVFKYRPKKTWQKLEQFGLQHYNAVKTKGKFAVYDGVKVTPHPNDPTLVKNQAIEVKGMWNIFGTPEYFLTSESQHNTLTNAWGSSVPNNLTEKGVYVVVVQCLQYRQTAKWNTWQTFYRFFEVIPSGNDRRDSPKGQRMNYYYPENVEKRKRKR